MKSTLNKETLVIRLPNWIGDTLMAYPMLIALKRAGIDFICLGHTWAEDLFSGTEIEVYTSDHVKVSRWCFKFYKAHGFEKGLLCPNSLSTVVPMRLAGINTVGYHSFSSLKLHYNETVHTVENYFDLAKPFIQNRVELSEILDKITIHKSSVQQGEKLIQERVNSEYIVICPYATNLHKGKNKEWPFWQEFCEKYKGDKIVALVSKEDYARCQIEFPNIIILSTGLSISGYIMRQAKFVLANDSGAMHLASFFGANIIGLFGATEINKTRPWYGDYIVGSNDTFIEVDALITNLKERGI
ncbi:MAG: glycosyltransferase family 9 protein [Crocinitomicaceae bacterium]